MKTSRRSFLKSTATGAGAAALAGLPARALPAVEEKQEKIVVMNPRGIQPDIRKIPMATRPATLDGRTVYIVDTKYWNTKPFVEALYAGLQAKYPKTSFVLREKNGFYMDDDPKLWKEIKEKEACAIILLGH